jgi:ParB-like chromosome segregation protein Spo0J
MAKPLQEDKADFTLKISDIIPLEKSGILRAEMARREMDTDNIYQLVLSDPREWPPIETTLTDRGYVLIDGYHRVEAAKKKGMEALRAESKTYPDENAIIDATFRANFKHGLKASVENRSQYARWLHLTYPNMTQQEIADRCQIKQATVSKAIARAEEKPGEKEEKPGQARASVVRNSKHLARDAAQVLASIQALPENERRSAVTEAFSIKDREALLAIVHLIETP